MSSISLPNYLFVFMPEKDLIGDVVAVRSTLILLVCAVFISSALIAAAVIFVLLRPLRRIATRLNSAATLSESQTFEDLASTLPFVAISEVEALKSAFGKMRNAMDSFERYVPRAVVKELIGSGTLCHIAMQHRACTMMFTQISRFGDMCDTIPMALLAPLLQQYFARLSAIAAEHDGVVDKFIGDTIMIVWGAPRETEEREKKAVLCGLLIARAAKQAPLHEGFRAIGETLRIRVGVSSGLVLAGNMGSSERMSYSVIGEAVTRASDLLEWCRTLSVRLLIDATTAQACAMAFCMHRVGPTTLASGAPYKVVGLLRPPAGSAPLIDSITLAELVADDNTHEIARLCDVAYEAYVTDRFDDCLAILRGADELAGATTTANVALHEAAEARLLVFARAA